MRALHATTVTICVSHSLAVTSQSRPSQSLRSPVALCNRRWPLVRATGKRGKCPRAPRRDFASYCRAMSCASACTSASRRADACIAADDILCIGTVAAGRRQAAPIVAVLSPFVAVVAVRFVAVRRRSSPVVAVCRRLSPFCRRSRRSRRVLAVLAVFSPFSPCSRRVLAVFSPCFRGWRRFVAVFSPVPPAICRRVLALFSPCSRPVVAAKTC